MNERDMAVNNRLLEYPIGSHLYGTNTPTSDTDFGGVFVADKRYYTGLGKVEEVDLSVVDKKENGRNSQDAVDRKFYEVRKFVKLAMENNPNIIEQMFIPTDKLIYSTDVGFYLLQHAHIFPWAGCYDKFIGYAVSQKKKMLVKRDNMQAIIAGITVLKSFNPKVYVAEQMVLVQARMADFGIEVKDTGQHLQFGDMHVQKNDTFKQALRKLEERRGKFSGRHNDFVSKYGYDTKFASHLIRLLTEGGELLRTGKLLFPLHNADEILAIKNGNLTVHEVLEYAEELEDQMRGLKEKTHLPKKPQFDKIEKCLMTVVEMAHEGE